MYKDSGFTLVEVLISTVILAVGLLGLAGLQATALRNNISAYHRTQATQMAYDMADRMRVNVAEAENFGTSVYTTMDEDDVSAQSTCFVVAGACSVAQLAQDDLFQWYRDVGNTLPSGTGTISVAGSLFTITVTWVDDRAGNTTSFAMSFRL